MLVSLMEIDKLNNTGMFYFPSDCNGNFPTVLETNFKNI